MSQLITPNDFAEITQLIDAARQRAYQAVNTSLIELYWQVGAYLSAKIEATEWGEGVIKQLAQHLAVTQPGLKGFTQRNLFRMRQFYETYRQEPIVSPLVTQLPWTHNLIILSQSKRPEEREFYLKMAIQEKWSKRELERQFSTALFERIVLNPGKASALQAESPFRHFRMLLSAIQPDHDFRDLLQEIQSNSHSCMPLSGIQPTRPSRVHLPGIQPTSHSRMFLSGIQKVCCSIKLQFSDRPCYWIPAFAGMTAQRMAA